MFVRVEDCRKAAQEAFGISRDEIMSERRPRRTAYARMAGMALAHSLTHASLSRIGRAFGSRDHTTVLHACRSVGGLRHSNRQFRSQYRVAALLVKPIATQRARFEHNCASLPLVAIDKRESRAVETERARGGVG